MKYRQKIFFYFIAVFIVFTALIVYVQRQIEEEYKTDTLKMDLEDYSNVVGKFVEKYGMDSIHIVAGFLPENMRLTIIDEDGKVVFDNTLTTEEERVLESHFYRPEIAVAGRDGIGTAVRYSDTKKTEYFYLAKAFDGFYSRVALPYNIALNSFLKADNYFLYVILFLFFVALASILFISDKLGKSIAGLNKFINSVAERNPSDLGNIKFPATEIGEIGSKIVDVYKEVERKNHEIENEKDKLIQHLNNIDEGIAIFSSDRKCIYFNSHYMRHMNMILDEATFAPESVFEAVEFSQMLEFLKKKDTEAFDNYPVRWYGKISKGGNYFLVKLIIFYDRSFEILLSNITTDEENRAIKHEMTGNIAHELRTPVSTISGYIETLLQMGEGDEERKRFYLQRTYSQVQRLSALIKDIALITKIEEASSMFDMEKLDVASVVSDVLSDLDEKIKESGAKIVAGIKPGVYVNGNYTLLYSIFRNLAENALVYAAAPGSEIGIVNYATDEKFHYFRFYDSGPGVPEEHLSKMFDRFYRVDKGRSRKNGGTGLGLSIVKNAVKFHGGDISARNRAGGGLEFMFSLKKM